MVKKLTIMKVLEPFLSNPQERLHLAHIAKEMGAPHPTVRTWLNKLEERGVLKKRFKGRLTLYNLNREHPNIIDYLVIAEKQKTIEICEKDLIIRELVHMFSCISKEGGTAVLFGSATESSQAANDIDLLITGKIDEQYIKRFSEKFNKKIHMILCINLAKVSHTLKKEIMKKHMIIKGSEDIVRWFLW